MTYITTFHGKFSELSALRRPFKVKICNYSHRRCSESIAHRGSMIWLVVSINCLIIFHCDLAHCAILFWFIDNDEYHANIREFVTIVENNFQILNIITIKFKDHVYVDEKYNSYSKHTYGTIIDECLLIDLRLSMNRKN